MIDFRIMLHNSILKLNVQIDLNRKNDSSNYVLKKEKKNRNIKILLYLRLDQDKKL